jgi:hypothetical protein
MDHPDFLAKHYYRMIVLVTDRNNDSIAAVSCISPSISWF